MADNLELMMPIKATPYDHQKKAFAFGVYVRTNGETHGTLNSSIIVDNETDAGKYLINEFLRPFEGACYYASIKNCVDKSIKHIFLNQDRGYYDD